MIVVALAGRRVDAGNALARFPAKRVPIVRDRVYAFLIERKAAAIVCSAACGADLLALSAAGELGLRRRVVLPFAPERFRETSVIDRGRDWGSAYDRVIGTVSAANDLVVLENTGEGTESYARTNLAILDEAQFLAARTGTPQTVLAAIVWDGAVRGPNDLTALFEAEARARGLDVFEIPTL